MSDIATPPVRPGKSLSRRQLLRGIAAVGGVAALTTMVGGCGVIGGKPPTKLTILTHWGDKDLQDVMQPMLQDYQKQNPSVTLDYQTVDFEQFLTRITTGRASGVHPDVYHVYALWLPDFVASDVMAKAPQDVINDVKQSYSKGSADAVTYKGQMYGYPTEVDTYLLLYNKKMYQEAGLEKPPATWDEFKDASGKLTKHGADGKIQQAGMIYTPGWDSGIVHPFTALLWSNGGQYVSDDLTKATFNADPGQEVLQMELDLINQVKAVDLGIKMADFIAGKGAQIFMANWWRSALKKGFPGSLDNVGVAPIPHGKGGDVTLQYNWLWIADQASKAPDESWKFLKWMNNPSQQGGSSPIGTFLVQALGVIPARTSDQEAHKDVLGDSFLAPFVASLQVARPEPVMPGGQEIKTTLQKQIEAAWFGQKSGKDALSTAADEGNKILAEKAKK
jgi:multiple sugar transport system substrate-binding protein